MAPTDPLSPIAGRRERSRHVAWSVFDQALSGISNFTLSVLVARESTRSEYGRIAVLFTLYLVALAVTRSMCGQVLLITASEGDARNQQASAQVVAGLVALPFAMALLFWALFASSERSVALALAVFTPAVLVQDVGRYAAIAVGRAKLAVVADGVWVVLQMAVFGALYLLNGATTSHLVVAWGASGVVSAFVLTRPVVRALSLRRSVDWLTHHRKLSFPLLGDSVLVMAAAQFTLVGLGVSGGFRAIAALKSGQLMLGPLVTFNLAMGVALVPVARRWWVGGRRELVKSSVLFVAGLAAADLAYGTALLLLPPHVGRALLGANFVPGRQILPLLLVAQIFLSSIVILGVVIRAAADGRRVFRTRMATAALEPVGGSVGAVVDGPVGAALGIASAAVVSGVVWFRSCVQLSRSRLEESPRPSRDSADETTGVNPVWTQGA